jgi:hypothetical protein
LGGLNELPNPVSGNEWVAIGVRGPGYANILAPGFEATRSNREFALSFASCVTTFSDHQFDWVARKGRHCIFAVLQDLAPKARMIEAM